MEGGVATWKCKSCWLDLWVTECGCFRLKWTQLEEEEVEDDRRAPSDNGRPQSFIAADLLFALEQAKQEETGQQQRQQ